MPAPRFHPRTPLYAIVDTGYVDDAAAPAAARALLAGGAGLLQLRAKHRKPGDILKLAAAILPLCRAANVPFILNDYPDLAATIGADGVHIGQDDGTLAAARAIVGPDAIIGRSTHSPLQAQQAAAEGFDYLGFGPLFPTATKPGRPAIGLDGIRSVVSSCPCPVFCIGGVSPDTLPAVLAAGATHVVVVSALLQAPDIEAATRSLRQRLSHR